MKTNRLTREEQWVLTGFLFLMFVTAGWWALALWPTSSESPVWLARTQAVCFGVHPGGLPDAAGWTGLIASPLGMFGLFFATTRAVFARLIRHLREATWLQVGALVLFMMVSAGAAAAALRVRELYARSTDELITTESGSAVRLNKRPPPLALVDQAGRRRTLAEFKGRTVLLTFAYAHCETVCPTLVRNILTAQQQIAARNGHAPAALIVTLDPERDTPARLPTIAREWDIGADAWVLSGSVAEVNAVLDAWKIARTRDPATGMVTHAAVMYVVSEDGMLEYEAMAAPPSLIVQLAQ